MTEEEAYEHWKGMDEDELYEHWEEMYYMTGGYEGVGLNFDSRVELFKEWVQENEDGR